MVDVKDVTAEVLREKRDSLIVEKLVRMVFGNSLEINSPLGRGPLIIKNGSFPVANMYFRADLLEVYEEKWESVFSKFGDIYEKILKRPIEIETNYSKND